MKERPIIVSTESVQKIIAGQKWQTRRIIEPQPRPITMVDGLTCSNYQRWPNDRSCLTWDDIVSDPDYYIRCGHCPYGQPGDRLWVREAWTMVPQTAYRGSAGVHQTNHPYNEHDAAIYKAGWSLSPPAAWRSAIFMPRWASRLTLEITDIRVERVQDISEADAIAEGCRAYVWTQYGVDGATQPATVSYAALWDQINGKTYPWSSNPWVWAITFKRIDR